MSSIPQAGVMKIVPRPRWGSWVLAGSVLLLLAILVIAGIKARIIDVRIFLLYLTGPEVLRGAFNAVVLGTLSLFLAAVLGFILALMRLSDNKILSGMSSAYIYFFRGTPMLIQLLFWFNAFPAMFPRLTLSVPFTDIVLVDAAMSSVVTPFLAALAGLALAESAYMGEIIRAGILAVDRGQRQAATALGMTQGQVMRHVVAPQAFRIILPAAGNQYIMLLKSTSLASTIGYLELLRVAADIYSANFRVVELITVCAFWYLVMTAVATGLQGALEKRFPLR
ncbi:MAG: amino acid ABC transporter permease [Steroidobacteraceae bacterium]